ncbi:MAG: hypothetical protein HY823_15070 [Acidobacteria bacterium]|nr:hypothetical protein [Acidobacteriota bacterium]
MAQFWHPSWRQIVLGLALVRTAWDVAAALRRRGPWTRALLPGILGVEALLSGQAHRPWILGATAGALEAFFLFLLWRGLAHAPSGSWPEETVAKALGEFLPPAVARLAALEGVLLAGAFRFLFRGWRRPLPGGFSYHRSSPLGTLLPVLPLLMLADVFLLEVLLRRVPTAWRLGIHALGLYSLLWLVGLWASWRSRPHQIRPEGVILHKGLFKRLELETTDILDFRALPDFHDDWDRHAALKGAHRLEATRDSLWELRLATPAPGIGPFGPVRARDRVVLSVDDPGAFLDALRRAGAPLPS